MINRIKENVVADKFPSDLLEEARLEVMQIMRIELWPQFIRSEIYHPVKKKEKPLNKKLLKRSPTVANYEEVRRILIEEERIRGYQFDDLWTKKELMAAFRKYLYSIGAQTNLQFSLEAQLFPYIDDPEEQKIAAQDIYNDFIKPDAPLVIQLSNDVIKIVKGNIAKPAKHVFADSLLITTNRLRADFKSFLLSDYCPN